MNNSELKTRFLVGYDAITSFMAPGYTDAEISGFLNQGMDLLVDELYAQGDIVNLAELLTKFDSVAILCTLESYGANAYQPETLIGDNTVVVGPPGGGGGEITLAPAVVADYQFRWFVNARLKLSRTEPVVVTSDWVPCELIVKPLADKYTQTAFNKPIIIYPKVIIDNNTFIILTDNLTTVSTSGYNFQCIYIRTATRIDVTTTDTIELHHRLHQRIVDKAIQLAMKANEPQRAEAEIKLNQAI